MRLPVLALVTAFSALSLPALAQPPAPGSTHTFRDPLYFSTVVCDTLEQVRSIVDAEQPQSAYLALAHTPNDALEPTCAAMTPTGVVVEVVSLGIMKRDGLTFRAWAVETTVGTHHGYALYLERIVMVTA